MIEIDKVEVQSVDESNLFLRALWARMRAKFGRLGWQYTPRRDGATKNIRLGWATLGASAPTGLEVNIHYRRRGILDSIRFTPRGPIYDLHPDLDAKLRECVKEATVKMHSPLRYRLAAKLSSNRLIPVGLYFSKRWHIGPLDDESTEIGLDVNAFDEADSRYEFEVRMAMLLDALAAWINCSFRRAGHADDRSNILDLPAGIFWEDAEWLEHQPIAGDLIRLEPIQLAFGDQVVGGLINEGHKLARAAHLFHEGLLLLHTASGHFGDLATALFISALEVISLSDDPAPTCQTCGQSIYKISKRVAELGVRHLGPGAKWVFDDHYRRRSRYLHTGKLHATQPFAGHAIPQLDPDGIEGCAMPRLVVQPINLMEFTSFIIRAEIRAYMTAQSEK
jgi:hypothetical protein